MPPGEHAPFEEGAEARRQRPWPTVAAVVLVAAGLVLTGILVFRDRQNAAAASSSPANAARDAVALLSLERVSNALTLANHLERARVFGLRQILLSDFRHALVGSLGGTLSTSGNQWTLALGGGWACLTWLHVDGQGFESHVTRGVCQSAQIQDTSAVPNDTFVLAATHETRLERAAVDAALVSASMASTAQGYSPSFSLAALANRFARLDDAGINTVATPIGVTVVTSGSAACMVPAPSQTSAWVLSGPCSTWHAGGAG